MTEKNDDAPKRLSECDPALYRETVDALHSHDFSPGGSLIDDQLADAFADALDANPVSHRCDCGQSDCRTYYFDVPKERRPKEFGRYVVVRFFSRGEHMLHGDTYGNVYQVERLIDEHNEGPYTIYAPSS